MSTRKPQSMSSLSVDNTSTLNDQSSRRARNNRGDSMHSRTSVGSLDDIDELEENGLARARDRIRRVTPNTPSSRSSRRTVSDTAVLEASTASLQMDDLSRRSSRRRVPRASRSNDSLGSMSASVIISTSKDENSSRSTQRSRRVAPARSKSTSDAAVVSTSVTEDSMTRGRSSKTTDERERSSSKTKRGSSRSRSKSKGARKRPGTRMAQAVSSANTVSSKRDSTESTESSTVTSTSRARRKPSGGNSLSGLSMLDDISPRKGPRDAKSVGVELLSPPSRSKFLPQRKMERLGGGDGGISSLAAFLNNSKSPKSNKLSSSRSVGAMPSSGSGTLLPSRKPLRRRLKKKGDDESIASAASKRPSKDKQIKGHSSLGSGLDLHTASSTPMQSYGGSRLRGRKPKSKSSSSGSDDSLEDESLHVSDIIGTTKTKNGSKEVTTTTKERLNRSMGDIAFKASDLGSLLAQQKEFKRRGGGASVVSELLIEEEQQDDIFSDYSWTTSRQVRSKVQEERKLLNDTLRQGTFQKAFDMFVGIPTS